MKNLYKKISKKINHVITSLVGTGIILLMLAILIVAEEFFFRLLVGIFVVVVAYMFFYGAYKLHSIKKEIKKHLNF